MLIRGLVRPTREGVLAMFAALKGREATPEEIAHLDELLAQKARKGKVIPPNDAAASSDAAPSDGGQK